MTEALAVSVSGLRKAFGATTVLAGIDLAIAGGTIFALLGPNGAGKTTTVQILSALIPADAGQVLVAGHDVRAEPDLVRAAIGVTGQFAAVDQLLTGRENLLLMAALAHLDRAEGRRRAAELLALFELDGAAGKPVMTFSGGMRRRLDLAMTLMLRPRILFLDEPTTGLDPRGRRRMWQIVRDLVATGTTVLLTTQYLEEADQLADRIAVLEGGRIVAEGTAAELKRRVPGSHILLQFASPEQLAAAAQALEMASPDEEALTLRVPGDGSPTSLRALLDHLDAQRADVVALTVHTPDLDDVFLSLTGPGSQDRPR
jgi:ABC-2 type transport system ATP-binding protein